jgi:beta-phosphoglucomutase
MIKAFIFDMDGTIVNNITYHHEAWLSFLKKYNKLSNVEDFHAQNHGTIEEMIVRFFGDDLPEEKVRELGFEKEETYRQLYKDKIEEVAGFGKMLEQAKENGIKVALATMGNVDNIDFILDNLKVREYFDVIIGGDQVNHGKPHPEIYERVLSNLELEAEDTLVFEDSQGGVISAHGAGLKVIGVSTTHHPSDFEAWGVEDCVADFNEYLEKYQEDFQK